MFYCVSVIFKFDATFLRIKEESQENTNELLDSLHKHLASAVLIFTSEVCIYVGAQG